MRKRRIYLDTSVISNLDQPEKAVEQEYSLRLWDAIIAGDYEVWLSQIVFEEIGRCEPKKAERLTDFIAQIDFHQINLSEADEILADRIIQEKILPSRCEDDSKHIAAALSAECDCLLSWNLKHLANYRTNQKIRLIAIEEFNRELAIIQPSVLLEGEFE